MTISLPPDDSPSNSPTPKSVANWMWEEFQRIGRLKQASVARQIRTMFGMHFVYRNPNRNWAINRDILEEFRKLTTHDVVWSRSRQTWRKRRETDDPISRMVR